MSTVITKNHTLQMSHDGAETIGVEENSTSKAQIAQSLASKDPAWFKQTEDRGLASAAYRRSQEQTSSQATLPMGKRQLLGLSRDPSQEPEPEKQIGSPAQIFRSTSPSSNGPSRSNIGEDQKDSSSVLVVPADGFRSPLPILSSQRFDPPSSDAKLSHVGELPSAYRTLAMSPSQGRISPERMERASSPTKGLGGFVQSAMLKRSDSVSKRWSAQAGPGLSRGNSVISNHNAYDGPRQFMSGTSPSKESRPKGLSRENSPLTTPRPGSSNGIPADGQSRVELKNITPNNSYVSNFQNADPAIAPTKPMLSPLKSIPFSNTTFDGNDVDDMANYNQTSTSPSKKWSPTKASWLENAINKPELPRAKTPANQKPSWMTDISRVKRQRGSVDLGKAGGFKEVTTAGLIRSTPPGVGNSTASTEGHSKGSCVDLSSNASIEKTSEQDTNDRDARAKEVERSSNSLDLIQSSHPDFTAKKEPLSPAKSIVPLGSDPSDPFSAGTTIKSELTQSSIVGKPKPPTPPKRDFKSNPEPRQISSHISSKEEPEFRNVFGKLRKTQTQNYVAPNELKDNILRGKAALAVTGGPKKTERRDDFKESILKQKEAMKSGPPNIPKKPAGTSLNKDREFPEPEAIVKKSLLNKSQSSLTSGSAGTYNDKGKAPIESKDSSGLTGLPYKAKIDLPDKSPIGHRKEALHSGVSPNQFASSLADILSKGSSQNTSEVKPKELTDPIEVSDHAASPDRREKSISTPRLVHITKTRAKGPKRRLPVTTVKAAAIPAKEVPVTSHLGSEAKSPRVSPRKHSTTVSPRSLSAATTTSKPQPLMNTPNNNTRKTSKPRSPRKPSTSLSLAEISRSGSPDTKVSAQGSPNPAKTSPTVKPKPLTNLNSRNVSLQLSQTPVTQSEDQLQTSNSLVGHSLPVLAQDSSQQASSESPKLVYRAAGSQEQPKLSTSPVAKRAGSLIKRSTHRLESQPIEEASFTKSTVAEGSLGLGIQTAPQHSERLMPLDLNLPTPPTTSPIAIDTPKPSPLPGRKPPPAANTIPLETHSNKTYSRNHKPLVSSRTSHLLTEYFGMPNDDLTINIDTQAFIAARPFSEATEKIKTLRKKIWEVGANGKSLPVPPHQEHILYEESIYLCIHIFGTLSGTRTTEVYLWCGAGASPSAVEDSQPFARRVAKDNNGRLFILQQGKETSNFFQALGGIVISRRGCGGRSGSPSKSAATYMLCGRRHLGQIAFDEVDFNSASLCSGFPFIISARFGKLYLWKGSGSGAEELGCARLIGMDLGLTGEIEEVDEGLEPDSFWESLPGRRKAGITESAEGTQYWRHKPSCETYTTRLMEVDAETPRPKSSSGFSMWGRRGSTPSTQQEDNGAPFKALIREVSPFNQEDIRRDGFYVLDAFFEVFVLVFFILLLVSQSPRIITNLSIR